MNPSLCRYYSDIQKAYGGAPTVITKYEKWISDPVLDRIDIYIEVPRVDYAKPSESIRVRVEVARYATRKGFENRSIQYHMQCQYVYGKEWIPLISVENGLPCDLFYSLASTSSTAPGTTAESSG